MNKAELVSAIQARGNQDTNKGKIDAILTAALEEIQDCLIDGGKVTLVGFGTFNSSNRKARKGRNPQTGEELDIPATRIAKFIPGKEFKARMRSEG